MSFVDLLWPAVTALALLALFGGLPAWALGLRGLWAVAATPAFALTLIGCTAVVAPWFGVPWSVVPVLAVSVLLSAAVYIVRRARLPREERRAPRRVDAWLIASVIIAVSVSVIRVLQTIRGPSNISQTFDNVFHLNAVGYILDTGNASSLFIGTMTSPDGGLPFYPGGWHALVSLVVQSSGATIPVAVNATVLVISAVIWPLGAILLTRVLFGTRPAVTFVAGLAAASLPAFPLLLMDYGVLYPYQLGLAVLPVSLAVTAVLVRIVPTPSMGGAVWWGFILLGVIPGMAIAHPGAFVAWLALTTPMALVFAWRRARTIRGVGGWLLFAGGAVAYLVGGVLLVRTLRPPLEARLWPLQMPASDAVRQVLTLSPWYGVPAFVLAVGVIAGVVWVLVTRRPAGIVALGMYLVGAGLFVTVASLPFADLRDALTGSWYNNLPRLAAILAIASVPIASYGIGRTWDAIAAVVARRSSLPKWVAVTVSIAAAAAIALGIGITPMDRAVASAGAVYRLDEESPLLSADEYALLERLGDHVPPGVAVAGSPWTGTSLAYAIADRPVLMPHLLMNVSDDVEAINDGLDSAVPASRACRAVQNLDVGFVLEFGDREVHGGTHDFAGFDELAQSEAVELVDEQGQARLYEIVACSA